MFFTVLVFLIVSFNEWVNNAKLEMEKTHKKSGTGFKTIYCCNPFEKSNHKVLKSLRPVQELSLIHI